MMIGMLWKLLVVLTAVSIIVFFLTPEASLGYLLKLFLLNWAVILLTTVAWPHIRGVRKGDPLVVRGEPMIKMLGLVFSFPSAVAMSNGRLNGYIEVKLIDGSIGIAKVVKYEGVFSNAEVELLEQHAPAIEIKKEMI